LTARLSSASTKFGRSRNACAILQGPEVADHRAAPAAVVEGFHILGFSRSELLK